MLIKSSDGRMTSSLQETCDVFSKEFEKVFTKPDTVHQQLQCDLPKKKLTEVDFTPEEVRRLILDLKAQSAAGPDNIHPRVLKECADQVSVPITMIFQHSLKSGSILKNWKRGNMTPIFKKGSKTDP